MKPITRPNPGSRRADRRAHGAAFTLVELLAVLAIVVVLASLLLPAVFGARARAKTVYCGNNLRQICLAMIAYAGDYRGRFPPNHSGMKQRWYDNDRIMKYLSKPGLAPPVLACPEDENAFRSYAMNVWASSAVSTSVLESETRCGTPWGAALRQPSRLILVAESYSSGGSDEIGWTAEAYIGAAGITPGRKFGGGAGLVPMPQTVRFGPLRCELPYERHRLRGDGGVGTEPKGRVNIGYADGHVATKRDRELVDPETGRSTLDTWWCEEDDRLEP